MWCNNQILIDAHERGDGHIATGEQVVVVSPPLDIVVQVSAAGSVDHREDETETTISSSTVTTSSMPSLEPVFKRPRGRPRKTA